MLDILEYIKTNKAELFETILNDISEYKYKYRNVRYDMDFSLAAVYCENAFINLEELQKKLRKTDRLIYLNNHLYCVILDGISEEACEKAAENINYYLLQMNAQNKYYLSAVDSKNSNSKYKNMIQILLDRLEYAIENNLESIVIYQDYVI